MRAVAEDILKMDIKFGMTLNMIYKQFYEIMRKHGIKRGTKQENGSITMNNFEWTMCHTLFLETLTSKMNMQTLFKTPKDLEC